MEKSNALAYLLSPLIGGECAVAILLPRDSEYLYISQLAVLQCGAAYICIDTAFPDEQIREILRNSQPMALLTDHSGLKRTRSLGFGAERTFDVLESLAKDRIPAPLLSPAPWLTPASLAYQIYTSGTTGRSKAVMIEHRSIANLIQCDVEEFRLSPADRVVQGSSPSYDSSVEEIWLAFASGATLVVMDEDTVRLGPDLIPWLCRERVTVFCPPPTLLRAMGYVNPEAALPALRLLYVGGETLPQDLADQWAGCCRLVNGYGPTECTVTVLRGEIKPGQPVCIGYPVQGTNAWVLNHELEQVADGEQGELCIGGVCLARGYHAQPELTAVKFPVHPRFGRIFRTGDLVHRGRDGAFFSHGRIDTQVKLRGYRIELEAIESRLSQCTGVSTAACCVQGNDSHKALIAFIVPQNPGSPPAFRALRESLQHVLPEYMVPSRFSIIEELPTSVGGKLKREALPILDSEPHFQNRSTAPCRNPMEERLAAAFQKILNGEQPASICDNFFLDLGGDSLQAARLISLLRRDALTASLTVRDLYEAPTIAALAKRAQAATGYSTVSENSDAVPKGRPFVATCIQVAWLGLELLICGVVTYFTAFRLLPFLDRDLGTICLFVALPLLISTGVVGYALVALCAVVIAKRLLIGKYRPLREPVWGSFYIRNWMVKQLLQLIPWRLLEGTTLQLVLLRSLGARIGRRVHLHRGVSLLDGGWDLLEIGDDVSINQDASIRLVELEDGQIVVGPVSLGNGSTLEVRSGIGTDTCLEPEAYLTALSMLPRGGRIPRGERWDGIPARPAGRAPDAAEISSSSRSLSPAWYSLVLSLSRFAVGLVLALPSQLLAIGAAFSVDSSKIIDWFSNPLISLPGIVVAIGITILPIPVSLALSAFLTRLLGRVQRGVIGRWSLEYVRVWIKGDLLQFAQRWLSGSLWWPVWLRCAGMKVGRGCEISTIIDTIPELVEIGPESFLADGIYLGSPRIHRGTVCLEPVQLGANNYIGNHAVIIGCRRFAADLLIGICTVADDAFMNAGTSWFGHPPFELPRREIIEFDRGLTHEPSFIRYMTRVFWELLRFTIPVAPLIAILGWIYGVTTVKALFSPWLFLVIAVPAISLAVPVSCCLFIIALKWFLLGRVRPGLHAFWSCWCGRWDFLYVAWEFVARGLLSNLGGTLLLGWFLRAFGARIGRNVVLGSGFAHIVDPDMLTLEDDATVDCMFQAHTFEDRVLKINHITVGRRATIGRFAVLLYGADIGARSHVIPHSVVMKHERLLPGWEYSGCPTRPSLEPKLIEAAIQAMNENGDAS